MRVRVRVRVCVCVCVCVCVLDCSVWGPGNYLSYTVYKGHFGPGKLYIATFTDPDTHTPMYPHTDVNSRVTHVLMKLLNR